MPNGSAGTYYSPQNPGLATVIPTGTQAQVFDQLAYLGRIKQSNEAARAEAYAKDQAALAQQFKDAMDKNITVQYQPYRQKIAEMNSEAQKYNLEILKTQGTKRTPEANTQIADKWNNVRRWADGVNAIEKDINSYLTNIPKDSPINKENFTQNLSKMMYKEDGSLKNPEEVDVQAIIEAVESDPSSYDLGKVMKNFMDGLHEQQTNFVRYGTETREEVQLKSKLANIDPETGTWEIDPDTNEIAVKISPETVNVFKQTPGGNAFLTSSVREMYKNGYEGSIGQAEREVLKQLSAGFAYVDVADVNAENQPKASAQDRKTAKEEEDGFKRFEGFRRGIDGDMAELKRGEGGKTAMGNIKSINIIKGVKGMNQESVVVRFERPSVDEYGDKTIETVKETFRLNDEDDFNRLESLWNEAVNSKTSEAARVPWENIRPFSDEYRKNRQTPSDSKSQQKGEFDDLGQ